MPKVNNDPEQLRPFLFHGVELSWGANDKNAVGDCPWCGRTGKFVVKVDNSVWRCLVCGEGSKKGGGNSLEFLRLLWDKSNKHTTKQELNELAVNRRLVNTAGLAKWGICKSILTGEWLIPGYNAKGLLMTLYRYGKTAYPTPTMGHWMFGANTYVKSRKKLFVTEGAWDGIAAWEMFRKVKDDEGNPLSKQYNVIGVPGCETFLESWFPLFKGKEVVLAYDSDYPREHPKTGEPIEPSGFKAVKRVSGLLSGVAKSVSYVKWGEQGYDPNLPNHYDVRDYIAGEH